MTATTAPPLDVSRTRPIPLWRLVLVELRKSYDTRAGLWYLVSIGILLGLVEAYVLIATLATTSVVWFSDFAIIAGGVTTFLLPVLAIMLVTGEWSQRSAMVTFAIEPRRLRVVAAKLGATLMLCLATLVLMFAIAFVGAAICELAQPDLTEWRLEGTFFVAFVLTQVLTMVLGFAFGALFLNTPASIVVFFLYWYLLPLVIAAVGSIRPWLGDLLEWFNLRAAMVPLFEWDVDTGEEWAKLLVSGLIWIGLPLAGGVWRILRTELK